MNKGNQGSEKGQNKQRRGESDEIERNGGGSEKIE